MLLKNKKLGFISSPFYKNCAGFSLVELVIALAVFSILAAGVFSVATNSYRSFYGVGDRQVITEFAQEGVEAAKSIGYNSWLDFSNAVGANHGVSKTNGLWVFSGTSDAQGDLTRVITVASVQRNSSGSIVASGGVNDPQTKKINVTISGTGIDNYVLEDYVMDWTAKVWEQTDWSGVGNREFWGNITMASSSYSNITTSTAGVLTPTATSSIAYLYSSVYDIGSTDQELRSLVIEQLVPSYCSLQITLEGDDDTNFSGTNYVSQVFSDTSTSNYSIYTSTTPTTLNTKRYLRYKVYFGTCVSNLNKPALYSFKVNYR